MANDFQRSLQMFGSIGSQLKPLVESKQKQGRLEEAVSEFDNFVKSSGVDENDPIIKAARFEVSRTGSIKPQDLVKTMEFLKAQTPEQQAMTKAKSSLIEQALKSGIEYTGQEPSELARQIRESDLMAKRGESDIQKEKEVSVETEKKARERKVDATRANLMLARTQENFANMVNKQKELNPSFTPGRLGGIELVWSGKLTGQNPFVEAFIGDLTTTAIALGRIASPGARVGPQFIAAMERTLPNIFSTRRESEEQLVQSATDAFEQAMVMNPEETFTKEQLDVSPQEQIKLLRVASSKFREDFRNMLKTINANDPQVSIFDSEKGNSGVTKSGKTYTFRRL